MRSTSVIMLLRAPLLHLLISVIFMVDVNVSLCSLFFHYRLLHRSPVVVVTCFSSLLGLLGLVCHAPGRFASNWYPGSVPNA